MKALNEIWIFFYPGPNQIYICNLQTVGDNSLKKQEKFVNYVKNYVSYVTNSVNNVDRIDPRFHFVFPIEDCRTVSTSVFAILTTQLYNSIEGT